MYERDAISGYGQIVLQGLCTTGGKETPTGSGTFKLGHMKSGSNNYKKQRTVVAGLHEHISNQRKDWIHKESRKLADRWDYICVEDISMKGMAQTLNLGKSTNDNGFGMFRTLLAYKMSERGKRLLKIDKWFPSSKMCHVCGCINGALTLSDREWTCGCGEHHDRSPARLDPSAASTTGTP